MAIIRVGPRAGERVQLNNSFIQRELAGTNEEVKQPHREAVSRFFAQYRPPGRPARCFCLPGARWAFENELERHLGYDTEFVGVERNYTILEHGRRYMPGHHQLRDEFELKHRKFIGFSSNRSKVVWGNASEFMDVGRMQHISNHKTKRWRRDYKHWTHAWLDFSGPIGTELITCCKRLENHLSIDMPVVPIAITFLIGREEPDVTRWMRFFSPDLDDKVTTRATFLRVLWEGNQYRTVTVADSWSYLSAGGVSIGVVTALMTKK